MASEEKRTGGGQWAMYLLTFAVIGLMWPLFGESVDWAFGLALPAWLLVLACYALGVLAGVVASRRSR